MSMVTATTIEVPTMIAMPAGPASAGFRCSAGKWPLAAMMNMQTIRIAAMKIASSVMVAIPSGVSCNACGKFADGPGQP